MICCEMLCNDEGVQTKKTEATERESASMDAMRGEAADEELDPELDEPPFDETVPDVPADPPVTTAGLLVELLRALAAAENWPNPTAGPGEKRNAVSVEEDA